MFSAIFQDVNIKFLNLQANNVFPTAHSKKYSQIKSWEFKCPHRKSINGVDLFREHSIAQPKYLVYFNLYGLNTG